MTEQKINLLGMTQQKLEAFFLQLGEKKFRAQQLMKWIYHEGELNFAEMTNLSKSLRQQLTDIAEIRLPEILSEEKSADGTCKWLVRSESGSCVEAVFIPEDGRGTLCVSSQVGCSLNCSFCSTGKQGFNSDLTSAEIIGQVWNAVKTFTNFDSKKPRAVTNVVLMGMGEPLLNFDNVVDAMNIMMDDLGFGLSKRRVTLSTSGVVPALDKLAGLTDVSLALSLHAANDKLRDELVPINKKYPIKVLLASVKRYMEHLADKRVVTIEYTMIANVNDSVNQAHELCRLLTEHKVECKINLIPFNPFSLSAYERPSNNVINRFKDVLQSEGYIVTTRKTRGDDIDAACGQLAGKVSDRTKRSERIRKIALKDITVKENFAINPC